MAVFTPVTLDEARAFLAGYDVGELMSLDAIAEGVENTNYRCVTTRGTYALTLFEKRIDPSDLPFYLGLMEHLAQRGFPSPLPERDGQGRAVGVLNGRAAALVSWLSGAWLRKPTLANMRTAGRTLAELHLASAGFTLQRENALGPDGWGQLIERCAWRAEGEDRRMLDALEAEFSGLKSRWPSGLPTGAIHADFFPDNVLFVGDEVSGVIDYYFGCTDAFAYDLAITLNAWCFDPVSGAADLDALAALNRGYQERRPLSTPELKALPTLCRGAAVRFTLTRLHDRLFHDPSWVVTPKDPMAFFRRLEFFQRADAAESLGLAAT
jgi:homoserine kinase type II